MSWNNNNGFLSCGCGGRGCDRCRTRYPFPAEPCGPSFPSCYPNGCPILLDTACSIYHKNMNTSSGLINLNLPNGSTLQLILETIDAQLGNINVNNWSLPFLREVPYTIQTLAQFGNAVDTEFSVLENEILILQETASIPNSSSGTPTVSFILTGPLNRNISANVNVSSISGNQLSIQSDGLFSQAQNLSVNYTNNQLTITDGNTVTLPNAPQGFLGNVTSDPGTAIDGNYWWNTTSSQLKIKVDGIIKIITTS